MAIVYKKQMNAPRKPNRPIEPTKPARERHVSEYKSVDLESKNLQEAIDTVTKDGITDFAKVGFELDGGGSYDSATVKMTWYKSGVYPVEESIFKKEMEDYDDKYKAYLSRLEKYQVEMAKYSAAYKQWSDAETARIEKEEKEILAKLQKKYGNV